MAHPYHALIAVLLVVIAELALMLPVVRFLTTGWYAKRRDILDSLDANACRAYFAMFSRDRLPAEGTERAAFEAMYDKWYGRMKFAMPALLLFGVSLFAVAAVVFSIMEELNYTANPFFPIPKAAVAALSGAYMWVVDDLISRCRRLDLAPSDLGWATLRLLIAVPMGYAFSVIVKEDVAPFITFALGAFPISALTNMLQRTSNKLQQIEPKDEEVTDGVIKLHGTDRAIAERLAREDIRTIAQMAYCDPVHMAMRSNLCFNFVTDLMNQALMRMYFRDLADKLTPMGMRGAVEIRHLINELDSSDDDDPSSPAAREKALAKAALPEIAAALGQSPITTEQAFRHISFDPYTCFLYQIWTLPPLR
jgi:hypothetical protein